MARDPVADHGGELSDLEVDVLRRSVADKIFIEPDLGAIIAGIESAIHARLGEDINLGSKLRVEK